MKFDSFTIGIAIFILALTPLFYFLLESVLQNIEQKKLDKKTRIDNKLKNNFRESFQSGGGISVTDFEKLEKMINKKIPRYANFSSKLKKICPQMISLSSLVMIVAGAAVAGAYGVYAFTGSALLAAPIGCVLGVFICKATVNNLYDKYFRVFLDEFVYALDMIVRGVRTGLTLSDCFMVVSEECHPIVGSEFKALRDDLSLGIDFETGMNRLAARVPLKEVRFFSISLCIQQKTGGNLAEIISNLANMLRQRKKIILRIKSLSQEAKTTALILGSLPVFVMVILTVMAPGYLNPLFETTHGKFIIAGCLMWMSIGILIMRHMINFFR